MSQFLLFLILGVSVGAVYASMTLGIVLTYQGTGVINFAAAAMATIPLYVYDDLKRGKLTLPLPWIPSFEWGTPPTWLAIAIALLVAAAMAAVVEVAISRPLRSAPALAKVVAAVGIMLTLQTTAALKYGTDARPRKIILPTGSVKLGGALITVDRLWLLGIVVICGCGLAVWFQRSRVGLSIQAAAENERAASFARLSPPRLGMITWVLASVFIAFVMILAGPATGVITPTNLTLLVVPALAAALVARLTSLWKGLVGALALGAVQSELQFLSQTKSWWPSWAKVGLTDAVPFVLIVITLFVLGRSIPTRGDDVTVALPNAIIPRNRPLVVGGLTILGILSLVITSGSYRFGVITTMATALIALSLVMLTGMVGQISLAQAAFAGIAGLFLSKIGTSIPFPFSMILAALAATAAGVIVGLPALRIRGAQLAVVTLAAALTLEKFIFTNPQVVSPSGDLVPAPSFLGIDLSVRSGRDVARLPFGLMVLAVVVIAFIVTCNVMRGGSGRKMLAVRSNERAAASIGIGVPTVKVGAFAFASFLAGLGGVLIGYSRGQMSASSFGVFVGLSLLATGYLAGITSASGAVLAGAAGSLGIVFIVVDRNLHFGKYYALLTGLSLIVTVVTNPVGLAGKMRADWDRFRSRRRPMVPAVALENVTLATPSVSRPRAERIIGGVALETRNVSVHYGGVVAVSDVSITVRAGEIVGLIGPNGAGKTSLIDAITGFTPCGGEILLQGQEISGIPANRRARRGLARTWQSVELFEDLSVENNVRVSADASDSAGTFFRDMVWPAGPCPEPVRQAIELLSLQDVTERKPSELPLGRQKALGVARSLALQPKVLLLDEPAAGLDTAESVAFGDHLREIASTGVGCVLIDHDMHLVLGVCDRIYVIEFGVQIAEGTPEEVRRNPRVLAAYLGAEHVDTDVADPGPPAGVGAISSVTSTASVQMKVIS
ncbi:MAG: Polyamine-transporting ATPase [Ilumatobacteraceae bacterium]|nr:Polyamine-transporting ATPase [Ilumatobacteraceae bacterium]